jgi:hypothetical protein
MRFTLPSDFTTRHAAWKAAVDASDKHVKIAQALQGQGGKLLEAVNASKNDDPAKQVAQGAQALAIIEKGVRMEREARDKLIELYQEEPKE